MPAFRQDLLAGHRAPIIDVLGLIFPGLILPPLTFSQPCLPNQSPCLARCPWGLRGPVPRCPLSPEALLHHPSRPALQNLLLCPSMGGGSMWLLPDCCEVTWTPASPGRKDWFASDGSPSGEARGLSSHPEGCPRCQPWSPVMGWPWPSTSELSVFVYCEEEHTQRKLSGTSVSGV